MNKLIVTLYGKPIGELISEGPMTTFRYFESASTEHPHALSHSLPFSTKNKSQNAAFLGHKYQLPNYFENLLPEGWLFRVAKTMKNIPLDSKLDMLSHLCLDTMGAVSFVREGARDLGLNFSEQIQKRNPQKTKSFTCGYCGLRLVRRGENGGFHENCAMDFFGDSVPPTIDVDRKNLEETARSQLSHGESVPGAQQKFSLRYRTRDKTIVMPGFDFIIKPRQTDVEEIYDLPRTEHIIMKFGRRLGMGFAETGLIQLRDGNDAFITKRFDRDRSGVRYHAEDFAQATGLSRGTESQYHGSTELLAKTIRTSSMSESEKEAALKRILKSALFNYLVGNSDAHLKNHSLLWVPSSKGPKLTLSPFYDVVPCRAYSSLPDDELGLKLMGKNRGLTDRHFVKFAEESCGLSKDAITEFISEVRSERQYLEDLMQAYEIDDHRQIKIFTLIAEGIKVLEGKAVRGKRAQPQMKSDIKS